jgi:hypothetical protein
MTETTKHTPGPWSLGTRKGKYKAIPANELERVALEKINAVCFDAWSIGTKAGQIAILPLDESSEANATLIKTAPQLLEALEMVFTRYGDENITEWSYAKAVMAKAKGEDYPEGAA